MRIEKQQWRIEMNHEAEKGGCFESSVSIGCLLYRENTKIYSNGPIAELLIYANSTPITVTFAAE